MQRIFVGFIAAIPEMHGSNALRQLKSLCFKLTKEAACSNLSLNVLKRMKIDLQPYVETVNPERQIDHDLLEYNVFLWKQTDGFSQNLFRMNFKIEEFYHGRLSQGGSSIAAFVSDTNLQFTKNSITEFGNKSTAQESVSMVGMNKTIILACPVEDYLNGIYEVYCALPNQCMFVNFSLMFLNFSAYMDANLGFNEPLRMPIYNIFCLEKQKDFKVSNPKTVEGSKELLEHQLERQQHHQHELPYWSKVSPSNHTKWMLKKCGMPVPRIKRKDLEKCLSHYQTVFFAGERKLL